jgi:hypothetical protein
MLKVSSTPMTGQPRAMVSRHLNDRDAAASVSSAVIDERPDTLHSGGHPPADASNLAPAPAGP